MNRRADRILYLVAGYCFSVAIVAASLVQIAHAQESAPPVPPTAVWTGQCPTVEHPVCAGPCDSAVVNFIDRATRALSGEFGNGVMFHISVPHPGTFSPSVRIEATCCEELCDKFIAVPPGLSHPFDHALTNFVHPGCPCTASGECHCASQNSSASHNSNANKTSCGTDCATATASACKCCPCSGQTDTVVSTAEHGEKATLIIKHAAHHADHDHHDPLKLMHHVAQLMAGKAGAEAALEVRKQADEQIGELFETLAEVMADNAALDARLDSLTEQRKLIEKLAELAAENAKLKAHVELAATQAETTRANHTLALENERLKHRLAHLEQQHADEATRTAAKPR